MHCPALCASKCACPCTLTAKDAAGNFPIPTARMQQKVEFVKVATADANAAPLEVETLHMGTSFGKCKAERHNKAVDLVELSKALADGCGRFLVCIEKARYSAICGTWTRGSFIQL